MCSRLGRVLCAGWLRRFWVGRAAVALLAGLFAVTLPAALPSSSAPAAAAPGDFRLPYGGGLRLLTLQGQNQGSHLGPYDRFAYDFALGQDDEGPFVVTAARAGVVLQVVQHFDPGANCDPGAIARANYIVLDHGDHIGTMYVHLRKNSALVQVGDRVTQGQPLARSGRTGFVCGVAHLHYTVVQLPSMIGLDLPFADPSLVAEGGRPKTDGWYSSSNAAPLLSTPAALRYQAFLPLIARRARP